MSNTIVLHQWEAPPFCRKVGRMLDLKGLPYEVVNYNGLRGVMALRLSPVGKLPVVDILGERVQDSTRIALFLDEHYPEKPLFPADVQQRALVELWEDWGDEVLYFFETYFRVNDPAALNEFVNMTCEGRSAAERVPMKLSLKLGGVAILKMQGLGRMNPKAVKSEFLRHLDRIEAVLTNNDWLVGTEKTVADISVGSQLLEVQRTSAPLRGELESRKSLANWLQRI